MDYWQTDYSMAKLLYFFMVLVSVTQQRNCDFTVKSPFPVKRFLDYLQAFEITNRNLPSNEEYFENKFLCTSPIDNRTCSCDLTRCIDERSCCIDIFWDKTQDISIDEYIELFIENLSRNDTLSCQNAISSSDLKIDLGASSKYMIRSSCSGLTHQQQNKTIRRPVIDSKGNLYRSSKVARCFGVTQYKLVDLLIFTDIDVNITNFKDTGGLKNLKYARIKIDGLGSDRQCRRTPPPTFDDPTFKKFRQFYTSFYPKILDGNSRWSNLISFKSNRLTIRTPDEVKETITCKNGTDIEIYDFKCSRDPCIKPYKEIGESCVLTTKATIETESSTLQYSWENIFHRIEHYVIIFITPLTIFGYVWAIMIFVYFKELQNLPRLNSVCMTVTLLIGDSVFYTGYQIGDNTKMVDKTFCIIHAITIQWCFICSAVWALLTASELAYCFSRNVLIPNKVNKRRFTVYLMTSISTPSLIIFMTLYFDSNGIVKSGIGDDSVCWMSEFKSRLYFYIIPIAVGYLTTLSLLVVIIGALTKKINAIRPVMKLSATHGHKIVRFVFNLSLVLGLSELTGFVQIRKTHLTKTELMINAVFGLIYTIVRSSRGILIAFIYICNKSTARVLKVSMRKRYPRFFGWKATNRKTSCNSFELTTSGSLSSSSGNTNQFHRHSRI